MLGFRLGWGATCGILFEPSSVGPIPPAGLETAILLKAPRGNAHMQKPTSAPFCGCPPPRNNRTHDLQLSVSQVYRDQRVVFPSKSGQIRSPLPLLLYRSPTACSYTVHSSNSPVGVSSDWAVQTRDTRPLTWPARHFFVFLFLSRRQRRNMKFA